jgi:hypothetical protein
MMGSTRTARTSAAVIAALSPFTRVSAVCRAAAQGFLFAAQAVPTDKLALLVVTALQVAGTIFTRQPVEAAKVIRCSNAACVSGATAGAYPAVLRTRAGTFAQRHFTDPIATTRGHNLYAIGGAGVRSFPESTHAVTTVSTIYGACDRGLAGLADSVTTSSVAVQRAVLLGLQESANTVPT